MNRETGNGKLLAGPVRAIRLGISDECLYF